MKKVVLIIIVLLNLSNIVYAVDTTSIIETQQNSLNISSFLEESEQYIEQNEFDIDLKELLSTAITGNINNGKLIKNVWKMFGIEILSSISILGSIIIIIIIHSILKAISDGLENKSVSQIVYYVQYILIVTIIMTNFSSILQMVRDSIQSLTNFANSLLPILITLMITTRKYNIGRSFTTNNIVFNNFYWKFYK